jgi:hypothetical protein
MVTPSLVTAQTTSTGRQQTVKVTRDVVTLPSIMVGRLRSESGDVPARQGFLASMALCRRLPLMLS